MKVISDGPCEFVSSYCNGSVRELACPRDGCPTVYKRCERHSANGGIENAMAGHQNYHAKRDNTPYEQARAMFNSYAAKDRSDGLRPEQALQLQLYQWEVRNFGVVSAKDAALGCAEELGEIAEAMLHGMAATGKLVHAVLKSEQKIRGLADRDASRAAIADGVADQAVFAIQLCTKYRLDFWTLVRATAEDVMKRDWSANPEDGGAGD